MLECATGSARAIRRSALLIVGGSDEPSSESKESRPSKRSSPVGGWRLPRNQADIESDRVRCSEDLPCAMSGTAEPTCGCRQGIALGWIAYNAALLRFLCRTRKLRREDGYRSKDPDSKRDPEDRPRAARF